MLREVLKKVISVHSVVLVVFAFVIFRHALTALDNLKKEDGSFPQVAVLGIDNLERMIPVDADKPWAALFWSTHCGPCRVEMELIQKAINIGYLEPDRVYAIHIGGQLSVAQDFMKRHGFTFPLFVDLRGDLARALDVSMTPTTFLVDGNREIRWATSGLGVTHIFRLANHLN